MDYISILISVLVLSILGLLLGLFLGISAKKLAVKTDPREEEILNTLPGANCGGCGYAGCGAMATAIVDGKAPVNGCPVGGDSVASKIAEIMGVDAGDSVKLRAFVKCGGNCDKAKQNYEYTGVMDCKMAVFAPAGGSKSCSTGCLGYGSCVKACPFNAIDVVDGIAVVNKDKCKACGKCVEACPKGLIELIPYDNQYAVNCASKDKGPVTMKNCSVGCIGCGICVKNCPQQSVTVTDFHAKIDYENCINCGVCAEKCPKKSIVNI